MLPINKNVYEELERTIENNGYEADLNVRMTYYHNVSRKQQEVILKVKSTVLILIIIKKFMICSLSKNWFKRVVVYCEKYHSILMK